LRRANCEQIVGFYRQIEQKFKEEITELDKLKRIPRVKSTLLALEKHVKDALLSYETEILKYQFEKDFIVKKYLKYIDEVQEKFADQSKLLIREFKNRFKKFIANVPPNITIEEVENQIGLRSMKDKLYEIEIWLKQKGADEIKAFYNDVQANNQIMNDKTNAMKDQLVFKKQFQELTTWVDIVTNGDQDIVNEEEKLTASMEEDVI
jgi:hypothetical protein